MDESRTIISVSVREEERLVHEYVIEDVSAFNARQWLPWNVIRLDVNVIYVCTEG